MPNNEKIISLEDTTLGYENNIVVRNLTFSLKKGDYLCIVGENGTGKSTLIKTLLGLVKPIEGKVSVKGGQKTGIGYLPQQTQVQRDFPASVWEVVLSGTLNGKNHGIFYSKENKLLAKKNIEKLGIEKFKKKCYRELSGGQQQRVLLARALCSTDDLLILDEPVTGLDPAASMSFYDTLKDLNENGNVTIIMVTHDVENALDYASHILHLKQDSSFFGTVNEYKKSNVSNIFLDKSVLERIYPEEKVEKQTADAIDRVIDKKVEDTEVQSDR